MIDFKGQHRRAGLEHGQHHGQQRQATGATSATSWSSAAPASRRAWARRVERRSSSA
ncbi:hypothetical protein THH46_13065 [Pseudomonas sp. NA13]